MLGIFSYVMPAHCVGKVKCNTFASGPLHHSQSLGFVKGLKLSQVCLVKGFDDPYLGVESPMVVEAQDLLYLSPVSWDQAMSVYGNCPAKSNWAGRGEEWQETGWSPGLEGQANT